MDRRDFSRIELQISKDVEKGISEVFPTSDERAPNFWARKEHIFIPKSTAIS